MLKKFLYVVVLLMTQYVWSQLESHKFTFGNGPEADKIDYELLDELTTKMFENNKLYYNEDLVKEYINIDQSRIPNYSDEELHQRLLAIQTTIPLKFTPQVGELIRYFAFKRRDYMVRMLTMSQAYFPIFEEAMVENEVPVELKCLSIIESGLNPNARSRVGATGLWQFMHGTARYEGMDINTLYDSRNDIFVSTNHAVKFLKKLYNLYGDWFLALAAYNAGPGNVNKAIKKTKGFDFWTIKWALPRETQNYVPSFIAMVYMMHYAKDYHLYPGTPKINLKDATVEKIYDKQSIKYIAELVGTSEEIIKMYNPGIRKGIIPKIDGGYNLVLPRDLAFSLSQKTDLLAMDPYIYNPSFIPDVSKEEKQNLLANESAIQDSANIANQTEEFVETIAKSFPNKPAPKSVEIAQATTPNASPKNSLNTNASNGKQLIIHKIKKGETLYQVKRLYDVSIQDLQSWNPKIDFDAKLFVGTNVKVYVDKPSDDNQTASISSNFKSSNDNHLTHKVKRGESLLQIAKMYNVTISNLREWNELSNDILEDGDELTIYPNQTNDIQDSKITNNQYFYHIVKSGDTLQTASMIYKIPVETLKKLNDKSENEPLKPGEKIKIPSL